MKVISTYGFCLMLALGIYCQPATAKSLSIKQCQSLTKKIENYTKLRKRGGSAKQMESWRKSRKKYKLRFREGQCKQGNNVGRL
jgi:hypothetical protein